MDALLHFIANFFTRNYGMPKKLGALSHALAYVNGQQALLAEAVKTAIQNGTQVVLPERVAYGGVPGMMIAPRFLDHTLTRIALEVNTTLGGPDYLLTEMLRQALCEDRGHYAGIVEKDTRDEDGRRGYIVYVNGIEAALRKEYGDMLAGI